MDFFKVVIEFHPCNFQYTECNVIFGIMTVMLPKRRKNTIQSINYGSRMGPGQ